VVRGHGCSQGGHGVVKMPSRESLGCERGLRTMGGHGGHGVCLGTLSGQGSPLGVRGPWG